MAFQGSLAELHLPDIIQLVSVSGKTGVFHLVDGQQHGEIWLSDGKIVHAEVEDLAGEEAVYALAIWRSGEFKFDPNAIPPRQTIQKSNTNLLMEAARRLDEWRVLSRKIASVELVPEFIVLENREGQINLNTMEWLLLSKIDGQRTVRQIATTAGMGVFDAAKLLYGLVAANLIRLKESAGSAAAGSTPRPGMRSQPPQTPPPSSRPPSSPGSRPPSSPASGAAAPLLVRLGQLRDECIGLLGPVGESVVQKHYLRARSEIERGGGQAAIDEAIQQIARAAGILKGSAAAEAVMRLGRG
jgi:hypothetical protein